MKNSNNKSQISNALKSAKKGKFFPFIFRSSSFILYFLLIFNLSSLIFLTCGKDSTKPDTVTFSGTVTVEGQTDHSGVKVSLYKPIELDTALVRINQQYPSIGVKISQETEFDHREHTPVYSTNTNAGGAWKIEDVASGNYNVLAEKDSFGWRLLSDQHSGSNINFNLHRVRGFSGSQPGQFQFQDDFIVISANTSFAASSQVNFSGVNIISLSNGATLYFRGSVNEDAGAKIFLVNVDENNATSNVVFDGQSNLVLSNVFAGNNVQVWINNASFSFSGSVIQDNTNYGLRVEQSSGTLQNNIFYGSGVGMTVSESVQLVVQKNVFINNGTDAEIFAADSLLLENNLFRNSDLNLDLTQINGLIKNNNFDKSQQNMDVWGIVNLKVNRNKFIDNNMDVRLNQLSHQGTMIVISLAENNFINTSSYFIYLGSSSVKIPVQATDNFWNTLVSGEIAEKIYDLNDNSSYTSTHIVYYEPFLTESFSQAGILP